MAYVYKNILISERLDVNPTGHVITNSKGQLISDNGTKTILQTAAASDGQFLVSDSAQDTGLIWRSLTPSDINIIAGDGLLLTGNELDVVGSNTIFVNPDSVIVNSSAIANQPLLSSGTVGTSAVYSALPLNDANAVTGTLGIVNGGTGSSSFATGNTIIATNVGNTALVSTSIVPSDITYMTGVVTTTDATPTIITSVNIPTTNDVGYVVKATFLGRTTTAPFTLATFFVRATLNNIGGTLTLVDNANDVVFIPNSITWDAAEIIANGTNISFRVTGVAATTINWVVKIDPILTVS